MSAPELRPLGIGEILDAALTVYRRNAVALWLACLPVVVLLGFLQAAVLADFVDQLRTQQTTGAPRSGANTVSLANAALSVLGGAFITGALFKGIIDGYLGGKASAGDSMRYGIRRLPSVLWVTVLAGFFTFLGIFLVGVGMVWVYIMLVLAVPVLLGEDLRGLKALKRSRGLVSGYWWRTFAVIAVSFIMGLIVTGIFAGVIGGGIKLAVGGDTGIVLGGAVGTVVAQLLLSPFTSAVQLILYVDQRVRKEGFDVQLLSEQIDQRR